MDTRLGSNEDVSPVFSSILVTISVVKEFSDVTVVGLMVVVDDSSVSLTSSVAIKIKRQYRDEVRADIIFYFLPSSVDIVDAGLDSNEDVSPVFSSILVTISVVKEFSDVTVVVLMVVVDDISVSLTSSVAIEIKWKYRDEERADIIFYFLPSSVDKVDC